MENVRETSKKESRIREPRQQKRGGWQGKILQTLQPRVKREIQEKRKKKAKEKVNGATNDFTAGRRA